MAVDESDLMSFPKYAKHRGVSTEAVSRAVESGRISTVTDAKGRRKIDPKKADIEWEQNTRKKIKAEEVDIERALELPDVPESELSDGPPPPLAESRARREAYAAKLSRLEYEEKSGKLVEVEKVKVEAYKIARIVRDAILSVPDRIDSELSVMSDRAQINRVLKTELMKALEDLAHGK